MASKNIQISIGNRIPTLSDGLASDCLSIEAANEINMEPGKKTQVNLTVRNSSSIGRMGTLYALYDPSQGIHVQIEHREIYIGPDSKTVTFALLEAKVNALGKFNVIFGVT